MDASEGNVKTSGRSIALWTGILAGPIAFAADLEIKYALVSYVCVNHAMWIMWVITIIALLITAFGAWMSSTVGGEDDRRVRFMAASGLTLSAMFALSIIAAAIPDLFLKPCD